MADAESKTPKGGFRRYAWIRIIVGVLIIGVMLWVAGMVLGYFEKTAPVQLADRGHGSAEPGPHESTPESAGHGQTESPSSLDHGEPAHGKEAAHDESAQHQSDVAHGKTDSTGHGAPAQPVTATTHDAPTSPAHGTERAGGHGATGGHGAATDAPAVKQAQGVAFVDAIIGPLSYELSDRFWGWRPNDVIKLGDNVINFQLGVLEVSRRAAIQLNDRISRTSTTAKLEPELENAMNWFMVKPDQYWFPSPETKYVDSLNELEIYRARLKNGEANFLARTDQLLPLLAAFVDLLGSCDENLVKREEKTGEPVPFYKADNYFFYAKGVATAMLPILEAVMVDFETVLIRRDGMELMHHAVENLERAVHINPWVIIDADESGILANHRANMAAPISHAMVYLYTLMKTLET